MEAMLVNPEFAIPLNGSCIQETHRISTGISNGELAVIETYRLTRPTPTPKS